MCLQRSDATLHVSMQRDAFLIALFMAANAASAALTGEVRDSSGLPVQGAQVEFSRASGAVVSKTQTDERGLFRWVETGQGEFVVRVRSKELAESESVVLLGGGDEHVTFVLQPQSVYTRVSVTASRGAVEEAMESAHVSIVKGRFTLQQRPVATIGNALEQEPGVFVQQSTYAQVSPFLRGFTGYHVLNVIDGVRFNNSTFRSGPNQYLAWIEPSLVDRVEVLLGPTAVAYGSDSLGGTIHLFTPAPQFTDGGFETHGDVFVSGASADLSSVASARVQASNAKVWLLGGAAIRRHQDLRAGGGVDSRNVYHRLFGLELDAVKDLIGSRLQDSGFAQRTGEAKFGWRIAGDQLFTARYQGGVQDGVRGYKDLLGGLGRMQSTFEPQRLDWFYGRYERLGLGRLDSVSATFSWNRQMDGGSRQGLSLTEPITQDKTRAEVYGYSVQAVSRLRPNVQLNAGGDVYAEQISTDRFVFNPVTSRLDRPRPLYPDGSKYTTSGAFTAVDWDISRRLRAHAGIRYTGVHFGTSPTANFAVPETSLWFRNFSYQTSLRWNVSEVFGVHAVVSRGFRAPNLNDLGALGLNDLGYEVPAADAIPAGALLSTDAGESATSKQVPLQSLRPESLMNYEAGVRVNTRRVYARVQLFDAELYDPIVRRTLLFPVDSTPSTLAGLAVRALPQTSAQQAQGVRAVATELDPRAIKAFVNDGRTRLYGVEALTRVLLTNRIALEANYSYLTGRDLNPNRNLRRLPPQLGAVRLRYTSARRWWAELSAQGAGKQDRLSGGDIDDERIGASRRRSDIAAFFRGSRAQEYVDAAGVFGPTRETLRQIQDRVLPLGSVVNGVRVADDNTRVPLYTSTAGWVTTSIRAGVPVGERWQLLGAVENLLDKNYRFHGSGVDAPGANAYVALSFRF